MARLRIATIAGSLAMTSALVLAMVGTAAAAQSFGSNFNSDTDPSNGAPAHHCSPDDAAN